MKKMTKKIVAIVTMMMFIVTMLPFAAFADTNGADASQSTISFEAAVDGVVDTEMADEVAATLEVKDENGNGDVTNTMSLSDVSVWAVAAKDVDDVTNVDKHAAKVLDEVTVNSNPVSDTNSDGIFELAGENADQSKLTFKFKKTGTYYIFASNASTLLAENGVKVVVTNSEVNTVECEKVTYKSGVTGSALQAPVANGIAKTVVSASFSDSSDNVAIGHTVAITTSDNNIVVSKDEATTNYNGNITFSVKLLKEVNDGRIYLTCGNFSTEITVNNDDNAVADIVANNTGKVLNYDSYIAGGNLYDAVTFTLTNKNGVDLTDTAASGFDGIMGLNGKAKADYISVDKQPATAKLTAANISLIQNVKDHAYTLSVNKKLPVGDYAITVALDNGKTATAEFTVAKFDKTTAELQLVVKDGDEVLTDSVLLGAQNVTASLKYVDANGLEDIKNVMKLEPTYGITGSAVKANSVLGNDGVFDVKVKKEYIGTEILVQGYDKTSKDIKSVTLTVVQKGTREALKFGSDAGEAAKTNKVDFTVVDENGKLVDVDTKEPASVKVLSTTKKGAKVKATATAVKDGKATLSLYSDVATEADIQVVVYNEDKDKIIAGTLNYTFGAKDPDADKSVVMTIGDSQYVVNNKVVAGDAAPYVKNDRTYVPIRALAEAFSADVNWDNDARTVTIVRGDKTIVMTVDKTTYTVNGEEATMDVAPEITGDRTYVPVRFVAEALGFTVTPFYAADGTTGSVLFQI